MTRTPKKPLPDTAPAAPAQSGLQDEIAAKRKSLAKMREQVEEWRRCRLNLTITQADRLNWLITRDAQILRDLEALAAKGAVAVPVKPKGAKQNLGKRRSGGSNGHRAEPSAPRHG